ncbi:sulfite exporter TauE/SafE family protein [Luteimonas huabeiensis]|uniref:sulfite exporter TauE/SafE family protein n=1 Tax=Luteimonas huabeiensis TaxID=1244513 RepID=UPI0004B34F1B|nr:sulfite exporter TauE/SafE family protein [Luteimonas huabeiensis]
MIEGAWMFPLVGAFAGLLAGLLGIGGGLALIAVLVWLLPAHGIAPDTAMHVALASTMASIVVTTAASAWAHHRRGGVLWPTVAWMVPGLLLGAWLGTFLAVHLDGGVLRMAVAAYCFASALQLGLGRARTALGADAVPRGPGLALAGAGIGAVSSLVGIGGGSMTVPLLVWRGVVPVRAVGTSAAVGIFVAIAAAAGFATHAPPDAVPPYSIGYVYLPATLGVAATAVFTAPLGTRLAHAISATALRRAFAVFMLVVGTSLLLA